MENKWVVGAKVRVLGNRDKSKCAVGVIVRVWYSTCLGKLSAICDVDIRYPSGVRDTSAFAQASLELVE